LYAIELGVEEGDTKESVIAEGRGHSWLKLDSTPQSLTEVQSYDSLHSLLVEFEDLFVELFTLPPTRFLEHTIHLKPNLEFVNVRSYRYSLFQKVEIKRPIKDMLTKSII